MPQTVRIKSDTYHKAPSDDTSHFPAALKAGNVLTVDDDTAKRWKRHGVAEDYDPQRAAAEDQRSADELHAEIDRLTQLAALKNRPREVVDATAKGSDDPLADYGLTEAQRVNLARAGFTNKGRIDAATDAELLEVDGIGEAAVAKLRGG